jgi:polyhydroxybutyrate depolymerase
MESTSMNRKSVIAAVLILMSTPVLWALYKAASFHVRNRNNGSMISSGERREYLLYVPRSYNSAKATPLVISMHGAGGWPTQQMELDGWNRLADREGCIVVYPSGFEGGGPRVWRVAPRPVVMKDVRFISDLIDRLESTYNIDRERIFADGASNGGGMAFVLSCTLSDRIAAIGLVAAAETLPWSWCGVHRPMPMIAFHGTTDRIVPYKGGHSPLAPETFPDVQTWVSIWARRNRCAPTTSDSLVASDATRREYTGCADGADVVLYTIRGGGHTWPGGKPLPKLFFGSTSRDVDATSEMWKFFRDRRLHAGSSGRLDTAALSGNWKDIGRYRRNVHADKAIPDDRAH